jgi:hypothetical protein
MKLAGSKREGGVIAVNTGYAVTLADHQRVLNVTATSSPVEVSIPSAGSLPEGFYCVIRRDAASDANVTMTGGISRALTGAGEAVIVEAAEAAWIDYPTQGPEGGEGDPGPNEVTTATDCDILGLLKGTGSKVAQAVAGTDYDAAGEATGAVADHEDAYDHSKLHDPVTVAGNGLTLFGQQVTLHVGEAADHVASGIHDHDGVYRAYIKDNLTATTAPTAGDDSGDGYAVGSRWVDVSADKEYVCLDASVGAAVWTETTGGGGFGEGFMATANSNQTVSTATFTKVNMTTEEWDSDGWYDAANAKFTPLVAGKYLVIVSVLIDQMGDGKQIIPYAYKNGSAAKRGQTLPGGGAQGHQLASLFLVDMNGSTDYIEPYIYHNHGADRTLLGGAVYNYFQAVRVG